MTIGMVVALRNARLDAITAQIGTSGFIRLYDGTRPVTGGTATTQLSEHALSAAFAPAASGGILTANAIGADSSADATGTATWGRAFTSGGVAKKDFSVGVSGADLNLSTTSIVAGQPVTITSCVLTEGNA